MSELTYVPQKWEDFNKQLPTTKMDDYNNFTMIYNTAFLKVKGEVEEYVFLNWGQYSALSVQAQQETYTQMVYHFQKVKAQIQEKNQAANAPLIPPPPPPPKDKSGDIIKDDSKSPSPINKSDIRDSQDVSNFEMQALKTENQSLQKELERERKTNQMLAEQLEKERLQKSSDIDALRSSQKKEIDRLERSLQEMSLEREKFKNASQTINQLENQVREFEIKEQSNRELRAELQRLEQAEVNMIAIEKQYQLEQQKNNDSEMEISQLQSVIQELQANLEDCISENSSLIINSYKNLNKNK